MLWYSLKPLSWRCTANKTKVHVFLFLLFYCAVKPTIIKDQDKTKTLKSESILNLTCKVDKANPGATIIWTYSAEDEQDNTEWYPIKPEHGIVQDNGKVLSIKNQNSYQGFYRCVAKNSLGEDYFKWRVLDEKKLSGRVEIYLEKLNWANFACSIATRLSLAHSKLCRDSEPYL